MMATLEEWVSEYAPMFDTYNETPIDELAQRAFFKGFLAAAEAMAIANRVGDKGWSEFLDLAYDIKHVLEELGPYDHQAMLAVKARVAQKTM